MQGKTPEQRLATSSQTPPTGDGAFSKMIFHTFDGFIKPPDVPSVRTVAQCLMRETRYCGNALLWFPVGLHSFVVADALPLKWKFHGLVHDAPECITGDIPHDLKTRKQRVFEDNLMQRFYHAWGVEFPTIEAQRAVKDADRRSVNAEVWQDCGTYCLREKYPFTSWTAAVAKYHARYSYADCLDVGGAAVLEFVRLFDVYKRELCD